MAKRSKPPKPKKTQPFYRPFANAKVSTLPPAPSSPSSDSPPPSSTASSDEFRYLIGPVESLKEGPIRVPQTSIATGYRLTTAPTSIFVHETPNEDSVLVWRNTLSKTLALHELSRNPDAIVDLHGHRVAYAVDRLLQLLQQSSQKDHRVILLIHGKGTRSASKIAVLRNEIREQLTQYPAARYVAAFRSAPLSLGGNGATLVLLAR